MEEAPERSPELLRRVFYEIMEGRSLVIEGADTVYIKHFTYAEQGKIEEAYNAAYKKAEAEGLDSEKACYELLQKEGIWTREEEADLASQKSYLESLENTKRKIVIPSQVADIQRDIEEAAGKITELEKKKRSLLPETCESYAQKKSNDLMVYYSFYKDKDMEHKLFSWEEYIELTKEELAQWFIKYGEAVKDLTMDNIKFLAVSDFFALYSNVLGAKNMHVFLHKPMHEHTFYQLHLLNYGKILQSILENVQNIPNEYKSDPDKLLDFASSSKKTESMKEKRNNADGYSVVGASKEDMQKLGVSDDLGVGIEELARRKGGTLSLEDFV